MSLLPASRTSLKLSAKHLDLPPSRMLRMEAPKTSFGNAAGNAHIPFRPHLPRRWKIECRR